MVIRFENNNAEAKAVLCLFARKSVIQTASRACYCYKKCGFARPCGLACGQTNFRHESARSGVNIDRPSKRSFAWDAISLVESVTMYNRKNV